MTVLDKDLVAAIESSLFMYPAVPGLTEDLGVPGVHGRTTSCSHPLANLVGDARLDEETADATIDRVARRFKGERKAFGWVTGPSTTPGDLPRRLGRAGMTPIAHLAGMAVTDLDLEIRTNPSVRVREVTPAETIDASEMMGRAYGLPTDVTTMFNRLVATMQSRAYFAYLDSEAPVAWSYLVYVPKTPIVLLGGAATLSEVRGQGLYSALVKKRLEDAHADGREAAVIQADRDTSAPICAKLGFRELCSLEVFGWMPE
ncbi:MAG TPA: hypothetical protein VEU77_04720 [Candidatus Acidoferrales bacterium]|nr:hypothetical protein [Candidatus Acidoferrales bacterium]